MPKLPPDSAPLDGQQPQAGRPDQQTPPAVTPDAQQAAPPVPMMLRPRGIPDQPEFDLEGPARETYGTTLAGRDYVPVEEWQIDNAETADIGHWGDRPQPVYTRDLPAAQRRAAEQRVKDQVESARQQAGGTDANAQQDQQPAPDEQPMPDKQQPKPGPSAGSGSGSY